MAVEQEVGQGFVGRFKGRFKDLMAPPLEADSFYKFLTVSNKTAAMAGIVVSGLTVAAVPLSPELANVVDGGRLGLAVSLLAADFAANMGLDQAVNFKTEIKKPGEVKLESGEEAT